MIRSQSISSFTERKKPNFFTALRTRKLSKDLNGVLRARPLSQLSLLLNLNISSASKRHSVLLLPTEDKENQVPQLRKHSSASKLRDSKRNSASLRSMISSPLEKAPLSPPSDIASVDTDVLDHVSPYTPQAAANVALDHIEFGSTFNHELIDWDEEPCSPSKLHRTTNMNNINDFIKSMDTLLLPLCNRASLEFEAHEIGVLQEKLQLKELELKLVENAMFLQFFEKEARKENQMNVRFWDDVDMTGAIKDEDYGEEDDFHLYL